MGGGVIKEGGQLQDNQTTPSGDGAPDKPRRPERSRFPSRGAAGQVMGWREVSDARQLLLRCVSLRIFHAADQ